MVIADDIVDRAVQAVIGASATGKIGHGKIFLYKGEEAIRIRNQHRGACRGLIRVFVNGAIWMAE